MCHERTNQARTRSSIYSWLSDGFNIPEEETLQEDCVPFLRETHKIMGYSLHQQTLESLEGFLSQKPCLEPLTIEYCRLFYGPYSLEAPPFESVYRDGFRLMGDSTMEVIRKYRQEGLDLLETAKTMPDHVAVEMEFMFYLCSREAETWDNAQVEQAMSYLNKQHSFLREHLSRWLPQFCASISRVACSDYYRSVAEIAVSFIRQDECWLAEAGQNGRVNQNQELVRGN